ncbi:MAG: TRAP transporter small permease [Eubacteriaceae bacterium]
MKKIIGIYNRLEEYLLVSSLAFNVLLVFTQVIMRSVFQSSLSWSEELSRYIFIWQIWLGTSIALREEEHINVKLIYNYVKNERLQNVVRALSNTIWLVFSVFLVYIGSQLVESMMLRNAVSSGLQIPLVFVYVALPLSSLIVVLRLIPKLFKNIKDIIKNETIVVEREGEI